PASAGEDPRPRVLDAMKAELVRSIARLRLPGYEAPYFIAYAVRDYETVEVTGKFGAVQTDRKHRARHGYVEVRVGDYQLDNSTSGGEAPFDFDAPEGWEPGTEVPLDDDADAMRGSLWLLTDQKYKRALAAYAKKRGRRATTLSEDEDLPSFSKEA